MHWILVLAAAAQLPGPQPASIASSVQTSRQARATIRILNGASITKDGWKDANRRVERVVTTEDGRSYQLRVTDFE
jgi:hypothetical protein